MYRIIIIDDEESSRNNLCKYFPWKDSGYEVAGQFGDGKTAFEWLKSNSVDVILCDIVMPDMDGLMLAEELYKAHSGIRFVFFSAYRDFEYAKRALDYGVKAYLLKPVKYLEMMNVLVHLKEEMDAAKRKNGENDILVSSNLTYQKRIVQRVVEYLENHYREATLEGAASLVRMSPCYLSQFYKAQTGQYFSETLTRIRMEHARKLLDDERNRISEVSEMVGYSNAKNFSRAYKRFFGKRPSEERRKSE